MIEPGGQSFGLVENIEMVLSISVILNATFVVAFRIGLCHFGSGATAMTLSSKLWMLVVVDGDDVVGWMI